MPLLRLNEHYTSIQGEGPNVGKLTQFVRFSGCNMRCPGWPCDTQHAIVPALWKNDPKKDQDMIVEEVFRGRATTGANHVCLTGGEPFMQDADRLRSVGRQLLDAGFTIDIFTNGSFPFPLWVVDGDVHLIMDWKLKGSGEANTALLERAENVALLNKKDAIKFVVKDMDDFMEAMAVRTSFRSLAQTYVGRVWDAELTDADIVDAIKAYRLPWLLNIQVHKLIWPNIERGI